MNTSQLLPSHDVTEMFSRASPLRGHQEPFLRAMAGLAERLTGR